MKRIKGSLAENSKLHFAFTIGVFSTFMDTCTSMILQ